MHTNFAIFTMACSIIGGHATPLSPGYAIPFGRHEHAPDTGLPGARHSVPSLQLLAKSTGLPATDSFQASTILGRAANVAGTKEVVGQIGRLLNAVTFAAFISRGSSDCLIGGSAVFAAGGVGAVRGDTLAILSGDHDRFGVESTATGHDVALDVDNAIRAYLTGKPTKNQSLLHEGGNGSDGETFGSVAADQTEDAEKGHQVKQVSRKLKAGGLLGRGAACADHAECAVGKCKGHRGQGMECRVRHADCKAAEYHNSKKHWGCLGGMGCDATASTATLIGTNHSLKWGRCTASPTQEPTLTPTEAPTLAPTPAPTKAPVDAVPEQWKKGDGGATCDQTCGSIGLSCTQESKDRQTALSSNSKVAAAFLLAGYTCRSFHVPRSYAGAPFSRSTGADCAPIQGGESVCHDNCAGHHAPLCWCM